MRVEAGVIINNRYEITYKVADGGMGELYYARDLKLNGTARALKVLKPMYATAARQQLLKQEAYLLTRLQHRCLPNIFDFEAGEAEGSRSILVMEWINGVHLGELLRLQANRITLPYISYLASEVLSGLGYLHSQRPSIIHRDLKPANIMIAKDGTVKLIDFGISKQLGEKQGETQQFGTRGYAAPEQLLGKNTDERSDIYSFGAVLLAMLGIDPFVYLASNDKQRELARKLSALPKELGKLIIDCVQKLPEHRPQSVRSVSSILQQIAEKYGWDDHKHSMKQLADMLQGRTSTHLGRKIAIIGAHTGAGATLLSLAIAHCCCESGVNLSYIEHSSSGTEMRNEAYSLAAKPRVDEKRLWVQYGTVNYCFAEPSIGTCKEENPLQQTLELTSLQALQRDVLVDYSSYWQADHIEAILQQADWVIIVSSPWLVRYPYEMNKLQLLLKQAAKQQLPIIWLSNRDQPFRDRSKWLELSAGLTHLKIPEQSAKLVLHELWNSGFISPYSPIVKEFAKYLMPLIKKVIRLQ